MKNINVEFYDEEEIDSLCSIPDCVLCERLNIIGEELLGKNRIMTKEFDIYSKLFYHRLGTTKHLENDV